jgi:hypothetical protein|nr:MAG TPA: Protein of unknown function (DUF1056) [Caudoviricetes sp.]DAJ29813.1 MAG TPA: Protein of unknown function (DUF1056) [Caudoviricetes sp.]DAN54300.1 MAG TPA: Protein of unknown function (DUF1056) [Caudoviricetes sp.]DAX60526.1 MAG TPA: Protein of unknown function (DUF1056) [Caudoviricetes sp.]
MVILAELLMLIGTAFLVLVGFMLHKIVGYLVLGLALIIWGLILLKLASLMPSNRRERG